MCYFPGDFFLKTHPAPWSDHLLEKFIQNFIIMPTLSHQNLAELSEKDIIELE